MMRYTHNLVSTLGTAMDAKKQYIPYFEVAWYNEKYERIHTNFVYQYGNFSKVPLIKTFVGNKTVLIDYTKDPIDASISCGAKIENRRGCLFDCKDAMSLTDHDYKSLESIYKSGIWSTTVENMFNFCELREQMLEHYGMTKDEFEHNRRIIKKQHSPGPDL